MVCRHSVAHDLPLGNGKETQIEDQKHIRTLDGTLVQSDGERRIADSLTAHNVAYRYDGWLRIIEALPLRRTFG